MSEDHGTHIHVRKDELFTKEVEEALAKERQLKRRTGGEPPPVSPIRRLLNNSLFYLPAAAVVAVVGLWFLVEPHFNDVQVVGGEVTLVDNDPFVLPEGYKTVTVGDKAIVLGEKTGLEKGVDGQTPFVSIDEIKEGDIIEASVHYEGDHIFAVAIRPATEEHARATGFEAEEGSAVLQWFFFPLVATLIALALLIAEGVSSRNWSRMIERTLLGGLLAGIFTTVAQFIPVGFPILFIGSRVTQDGSWTTIQDIPAGTLITWIAFRSAAWAAIGAAMGVGMNLVRTTKAQLRNSVLGGTLGGAIGGLLFDPIDRFARDSMFYDAGFSRLVGLIAVAASVGIFVALVERLAREAWIRVRTGPLAGKSFVLYKTPTIMGSSPQCDIYLFKDAEIDGTHAQIHRVGTAFELEDMGSRMGTKVGATAIRRRRLASGDQIVMGATVVEFEERAKRSPQS
jgi:hypothetical protein